MSRIKGKILEIEKYLEELESVPLSDFEQYKKDFKIKAICERYFEKIIEASIDLAFLMIKEKKFKLPEDDKQAFDILLEEKVISNELAEKLKDAKGMRNIIAHEYGEVNDELVFEAIKEQLVKDINGFLDSIRKVK